MSQVTFDISDRVNKKYVATVPVKLWNIARPSEMIFEDKKVHFGDDRYQHYYDKLGAYSHLNHNDQERRREYFNRHSKIMTNKGKVNEMPSYLLKYSPEWFSMNYLW